MNTIESCTVCFEYIYSMPVFGAIDTSSMESSSTLHWVVNRVNQTHISAKYQVWNRYHIRTILYFFELA